MPKKKVSSVLTIRQIEQQIFEREGFHVILRLPTFLAAAPENGVGYNYQRALSGDSCVAHLWERLRKTFGTEVEFVVIRGDGKIVDGGTAAGRNMLLSTIRNTYA